MKVVVLGLWHLGCVTAACCAKFVDVVGLDFEQPTVDDLRAGKPPVFEPGLANLIQTGSCTLTNNGTINETGSNYLILESGTTLSNTATYDFISDSNISESGGGTLNNSGTVEKTGGTHTSFITSTFNNTSGTIDAESGKVNWRATVGRPYSILPFIAVNSRSVYVIANVQLHALDRATGNKKWDYRLPAGVAAGPAVDDQQIYIPASDGRVYAFTLPFVGKGAMGGFCFLGLMGFAPLFFRKRGAQVLTDERMQASRSPSSNGLLR